MNLFANAQCSDFSKVDLIYRQENPLKIGTSFNLDIDGKNFKMRFPTSLNGFEFFTKPTSNV